MITNPGVFDEEYVPADLPHRTAEVSHLSRALEPALDGDRADDVLIAGPSGVGKTALARHTLGRLDRHAAVTHAHIRTLGMTTGDILRSILEQHPRGERPARTTPVADVHAQLASTVDRPLVVVLDEADGLHETDAIATLRDVQWLSLIVICHDATEWLARADGQIQRRFHGNDHRLALDRYGVAELADILSDRAHVGLESYAYDRETLEQIADGVAGVARDGIQSLYAAAQLARERGHAELREEDIQDGFDHAQQRIRESNLRSLPFHHQVLYALIHEAGEITGGDLHDRYNAVKAEVYTGQERTPIGKRSRRYKLQKLEAYTLIERKGDTRGTVYQVCDDSITPVVGLDHLLPRSD